MRTTVDSTAGGITIYDSGATAHMSLNRDKFVDFKNIEPKGVKAAHKAIFLATGVGCMNINVPNGKDMTTVVLKDVLYCPDLGYTLVSLVKCNVAGFSILLKDKSSCIKDSKGYQIGRIPQYHGLYHIDEGASVHITTYMGIWVHMLDELRWKMSHISHTVIKHLVEQKIKLSLKLDTKARSPRKPIPKERIKYVSHALGDKIHLDIWGPVMVQSYN